MTTNAFIFAWDMHGIESIVPISQYEHIDRDNTMRILREERIVRSPMNTIIQNLILRAQFNPQRNYEIYAIDCDESLDEVFWRKQWHDEPQATADLIRERGHKLYSNRVVKEDNIAIL
jgi:hypothetical protein